MKRIELGLHFRLGQFAQNVGCSLSHYTEIPCVSKSWRVSWLLPSISTCQAHKRVQRYEEMECHSHTLSQWEPPNSGSILSARKWCEHWIRSMKERAFSQSALPVLVTLTFFRWGRSPCPFLRAFHFQRNLSLRSFRARMTFCPQQDVLMESNGRHNVW